MSSDSQYFIFFNYIVFNDLAISWVKNWILKADIKLFYLLIKIKIIVVRSR